MVTYWDAVGVLLTNTLGFCLALLEGMLVLELGSHYDGSELLFAIERVCCLVG